jgi:hypothetical protein
MNPDDLKRILMGPTLFRLDTILSPRLVPVLYLLGLAALMLWAVIHLFDAFGRNFGDGLWGLLEIAVFGSFALVTLRIACEALLVFFQANAVATDRVSRTRVRSTLLDEVSDALRDIAEDEDEDDDLGIDDLIMPATDPLPDSNNRRISEPVLRRRTARRTPPRM